MLNSLDGLLTLALALLALFGGWFHCVAETPTHAPGFWNNAKAQFQRVRPFGWLLAGLVLLCTGVSFWIHYKSGREQEKQYQSLADATKSLNDSASEHGRKLSVADSMLDTALAKLQEQSQRMTAAMEELKKIGGLQRATYAEHLINETNDRETAQRVQFTNDSVDMADMALQHHYSLAILQRLPLVEIRRQVIASVDNLSSGLASGVGQLAEVKNVSFDPAKLAEFNSIVATLNNRRKAIDEETDLTNLAADIVEVRRELRQFQANSQWLLADIRLKQLRELRPRMYKAAEEILVDQESHPTK